jgi:hypothetical protein
MRVLPLVGLLALFGSTAQAQDVPSHHGQIEGTWLSVVYNTEGTPRFQMLHNFTRDGRTTMPLPSGLDELIGQTVSVAQGDPRSACVGEWQPVGGRTFEVTLYCLWRQNPGLDPDRIRLRLTLSRDGQVLSGPFKYLFADPLRHGTVIEREYTLTSVRLPLVPLD